MSVSDYSERIEDLVRVDVVLDDLAQGSEDDPGGWSMSWGAALSAFVEELDAEFGEPDQRDMDRFAHGLS